MKILLILTLGLFAIAASAQTITGKVIDSLTSAPIPFAHIAVPETGEGTVTDEEGNFKLFLKNGTKARSLKASFVGYQPCSRTFTGSGRPVRLALIPDTTLLDEVIITPRDPVELIREALARMPENHGGHRVLHCFYRLTAKNRDSYIHVSEASFELHQQPEKYNSVNVLKARQVGDDRAFNGVGMGFGTKIGAVKKMDLTVKPEDSFLGSSGLKKHNFTYEGVTNRAGTEVHEISFDQKPKVRQSLFRGKLYLSTATLALVEVHYELSPRGIRHVTVGNAAERAALKLLNIDITVQRQRTVVTYRPFGRRWYPDHVSKDETVRVKSKRYNFDVTADERIDFLTTAIDTGKREPPVEEETTSTGFLEASGDTTGHFWDNHNIIPSQVDYDQVAATIEGRNGYTLLKARTKERLSQLPKSPDIRVDSILSWYHQQGFFNGTALIKHKGKVIVHKGYGYADKEAGTKNDSSTVFRIGSLSKTFTSYVIRALKEEGLLQYRDSVQKFIPWYPHRGITIEHLLTHSSGIPNYTDNAQFIDSIRHPYTLEELIRNFGLEQPSFPAGTDFSYSNTGFTLLALIAEKASGKSFDKLITEKITVPLGMTASALAPVATPSTAKGYLFGAVEPLYHVRNVTGAGGIASTTTDLLRWDEALYHPALTDLFEPRTYYKDWGAHYGYGWMIDQYQFRISKKHTILYHPGTDFGFKSMMARQPDRKNLVVLLNNTGEFPLFDITDLIFRVLN